MVGRMRGKKNIHILRNSEQTLTSLDKFPELKSDYWKYVCPLISMKLKSILIDIVRYHTSGETILLFCYFTILMRYITNKQMYENMENNQHARRVCV